MPDVLEPIVGSLWLYAVVYLVSGLDALLPFMPSETTVVAVSVFAAHGEPRLAWVIGVAAAGAFAGDNLAYWIGRRIGPGVERHAARGRRRA